MNELTHGYTVQHCASCIATLCIVHRVSGPWDLLGASCTSTTTSLKLLHFFWLTNKGYCARKLSTLASNYIVSFSEHMFDLTNRMWFSVVCTFIDNDTDVITVVQMLWTHEALFFIDNQRLVRFLHKQTEEYLYSAIRFVRRRIAHG